MMRKPSLALLAELLAVASASAQPMMPMPAAAAPEGLVVMVQRSDFSRYDDGDYIGHVYREHRLELEVTAQVGGARSYVGDAFVYEETLRDMRLASRRVDEVRKVEFETGPAGTRYGTDEGYPTLRGFPTLPDMAVEPGARWTGEATVVVMARSWSPPTRVPVLVEYQYLGMKTWDGGPVYSIGARYALRYRGGDPRGDSDMQAAVGGRTAEVLVDADDGTVVFIRETVDETYSMVDGHQVRLKGFILHFMHGSSYGDADRIAALLGGTPGDGSGTSSTTGNAGAGSGTGSGPGAGAAGTTPGDVSGDVSGGASGGTGTTGGDGQASAVIPGSSQPFELARTDRGVVLLLFDLRFAPDSAELLPGEAGRLDAIAAALKSIPDRTFLVEGHAADVGKPQGQYELSEQRAKSIVDALVARGLPASRFIYRGLGADRPLASNADEAGRARNRRVEITILN